MDEADRASSVGIAAALFFLTWALYAPALRHGFLTFDDHAWGHPLTNILLHADNAALLFVVLQMLTGSRWRSAAVAALFAWHPAHPESVRGSQSGRTC